jgi:hypothetical protein
MAEVYMPVLVQYSIQQAKGILMCVVDLFVRQGTLQTGGHTPGGHCLLRMHPRCTQQNRGRSRNGREARWHGV